MASQGPLAWGLVAAVWQGMWREGQLILRKVRRPSLGPADAKGSELSWGVGVCVCVCQGLEGPSCCHGMLPSVQCFPW